MKTIKIWAIFPNDNEYSVQYCETKEQAELFAKSYDKIGGAQIAEVEQLQKTIDRKNKRTALRGYKL